MTLEQKHPNLKKLLVLFLVVFLILVGLAGLKLYLDVSKSSDAPAMQDEGMLTDHPTEADIAKQLETLNAGSDPSKLPAEEEIVNQLEALDAGDDMMQRPTEAEMRQQLETLNQ